MRRSGLVYSLIRIELAPFMGAMFVSNVGRNAYFVGMAWIALTWSNSMRVVALLLLVGTITEFLSSGISGHLADAMSKRRLALLLDAGRAVVVLLTGLIATTDADIWLLFISMALYSAVDRAYLTAMQGMIPQLSEGDSSLTINSASYLMMQSGNFFGALLIGFLLHALPYGPSISLLSIIFASSTCVFAFQREMEIGGSLQGGISRPRWRQAIAWRYVADHRLVLITVCYSVVLATGVLVNTLLPSYVIKELGGTSILLGQLESSWAFGSVVACLCLAVGIGAKPPKTSLLPLLMLSGMALLAFGIFPHPIVSLTMLWILGALYNVCRVAVDVHIQRVVAVFLVGRAKGTVQMIAAGFGLAIYGLIAVATDIATTSAIFAAYGVFLIVVAFGLLLVSTREGRRLPEIR